MWQRSRRCRAHASFLPCMITALPWRPGSQRQQQQILRKLLPLDKLRLPAKLMAFCLTFIKKILAPAPEIDEVLFRFAEGRLVETDGDEVATSCPALVVNLFFFLKTVVNLLACRSNRMCIFLGWKKNENLQKRSVSPSMIIAILFQIRGEKS